VFNSGTFTTGPSQLLSGMTRSWFAVDSVLGLRLTVFLIRRARFRARSSATNDIRMSQFHIQTIGPMPIRTIPNVVEILPAVPKISTRIPATTGAVIKNHRVARTVIAVSYPNTNVATGLATPARMLILGPVGLTAARTRVRPRIAWPRRRRPRARHRQEPRRRAARECRRNLERDIASRR